MFQKKEEGKPWINEYQIPVRRPLAGDLAGPSASSMRLPTERRCRRLHSPQRRSLVAARLPQASAPSPLRAGLKEAGRPPPPGRVGGARPSLSSWVRPSCASGYYLPWGHRPEARAPHPPQQRECSIPTKAHSLNITYRPPSAGRHTRPRGICGWVQESEVMCGQGSRAILLYAGNIEGAGV